MNPMDNAAEIKSPVQKQLDKPLTPLQAENYLKACIVNCYVQCLKGMDGTDIYMRHLADHRASPETEQGRVLMADFIFLQFSKELMYNDYYKLATANLNNRWNSQYVLGVLSEYKGLSEIDMDKVISASANGRDVLHYNITVDFRDLVNDPSIAQQAYGYSY